MYRFTLSVVLIAGSLLCSQPGHPRDFRGIGRSDELLYEVGGQSYTALSDGHGAYQYVPNLFSANFDILRTGDFNGDGKSDLILYRTNSRGCPGPVPPGPPTCQIDNSAYIGFSNGDGTFSFQSLFWSPYYQIVETGDINGDGKTDVLLYKPNSLDIGLSDGKGGFTYTHYLVFQPILNARLADITGDGKADLLIYDGFFFITGVSNGDGTFAFTAESLPSLGYPTTLAVGDLNGDGRPDVFLYNSQTGAAATGIITGGIPTFHTVQLSPGFTTVRIANGRLILYSSVTGAAYIGALTASWTYSLAPLPWGPGYDIVEFEDVNGDGLDDVILFNHGTGTSYTGLWVPGLLACVGCPQGGFTNYTYFLWGAGRFLVDEPVYLIPFV